MNMVFRFVQRAVVFCCALIVLWLIATIVIHRLDERIPLFIALIAAYALIAYIILPPTIHVGVLLLRRGRIPRFTLAKDGLPADPVNIAIHGSRDQLARAFERIGWNEAEKLTLRTTLRMIHTFIHNCSYPGAPFSSLILFGRVQDIGFEQSISKGPRKRHHVRFWEVHTDHLPNPLVLNYWRKRNFWPASGESMWVGSVTKDIGFGFASFTYQLSHKVDPDVDYERGYLRRALEATGEVAKAEVYESEAFSVGRYRSDGKILVLTLRD